MNTDLIVALDVPDSAAAVNAVESLPGQIRYYKIGLELFCAEGPRVVEQVRNRGKQIFLDLKLHDIPRTVERAVRSLSELGVSMFTVHASGGRAMLKAAVEAARISGGTQPKVIAVTALTSLDAGDLADIGVNRSPSQQVRELARFAIECGVDGLVSSPQEVEDIRKLLGPKPILITPGIRPSGGEVGDQKRVATPAAAAKAGSSFLVVGRPILDAPDPASAAAAVLKEIGR
jgi:orotidine-5'-phosphate decarboxylase